MKKILFVFGTRPEIIKMAPVILEAQKYPKKFNVKICITEQHKEMLQPFLKFFKIKPDYNLKIMKKEQSLEFLTSKILQKLEKIIKKEKPDLVMVQGDTTTAFASTLCAFYQKIKVAHIEAGLRSFNKYNPFPEEINRKIIDIIADYLFVPTEIAKKNLIKEGLKEKKIFVTGNTVIDTLKSVIKRKREEKKIENFLKKEHNININKKIILITLHRRESWEEDLENMCYATKELAKNFPDLQFVYPVHLNPNVRKTVLKILKNTNNIHLISPLNYLEFVFLMKKSFIIMTDSGGIQEEACFLKKPVLVMRRKTERIEGIKNKVAKLVGTEKDKIINEFSRIINNKNKYLNLDKNKFLYGDGNASKRIIKILNKCL